MVSNARDDLPEPERPVITTRLSRGISTSTFLRLCSRAPLILIPTILFMRVARSAKKPALHPGPYAKPDFQHSLSYHGAVPVFQRPRGVFSRARGVASRFRRVGFVARARGLLEERAGEI